MVSTNITYAFTISCLLAGTTLANKWEEGPAMAAARSEMAATLLDGKIYASGGFGSRNALEAFDIAANTWKTLKPNPQGHDHHMAEAFGGKIYILQNKTWQYDPVGDTWAEKAAGMNRADAASAVLGGYIYVVGGNSKVLQRYGPTENKWESLAAKQQ